VFLWSPEAPAHVYMGVVELGAVRPGCAQLSRSEEFGGVLAGGGGYWGASSSE